MSFRDCVQAAVDGQRVSADRGQKAIDAYEQAKAKAEELGHDAGSADTAATSAALETITTGNAERRWTKLKEMQVAHRLIRRMEGSKNPSRSLTELALEMENAYETVQAFAMGRIDQIILKYQPKALRRSSTDNMDEIVHAAFGDVRNPEAGEAAKAITEVLNDLREWANMYGANVPKNKNYSLFQTHDSLKVSSVTQDVWVNDHLQEGVLDWDMIRFEGKLVDPSNRRAVLERVYQGIISDGALRAKYLQEGKTPNLANRMNRDRFLHYSGAQAWLNMQKKYGEGNLHQQLIGMIDGMAKDISTMRVFGPSPDSMRQYVMRLGDQRAAQLDLAKGANKRKEVDRFRRESKVFDDMYTIHTRQTMSMEGNPTAQAISGARSIIISAQLGKVLIPSFFGDQATRRIAKKMHGMPGTGVMGSYFNRVAAGEIGRAQAIRFGIINESAVAMALSRNRFLGALDGPAFSRMFSDQVYRIGLAAQHMTIAREAEGLQFLGWLADTRKLKFDDHPAAPAMLEMGITEKDWDIMRAFPVHNERGATFLLPVELFRVGNAAEKQVAEKFSDFLQTHLRLAVPQPDLRSRRAMGEAIDPNSAMGQLGRTMTSLLSFPVAIHFNHLRRIHQAPDIRNKFRLFSHYLRWMTLSGAAITQAKALMAGQQLHDMTLYTEDDKLNLDFWGRSVINGGSLGILGDVVMNNFNLSNSPYRAGNPSEQFLATAQKATLDNLIDAYNGEEELKIGADMLKLSDAMLPNFWQVDLVLQRTVDDTFTQMIDPAGYEMRKRYEQEHAEGMWWGQGESAQAPNLATAIGDY